MSKNIHAEFDSLQMLLKKHLKSSGSPLDCQQFCSFLMMDIFWSFRLTAAM